MTIREQIRRGAWTGQTSGLAEGYVQANLVILPRSDAYDFLLFCERNPKPCPLLDITEAGSPVPEQVAPEADLRTDLPRYRVYRHGELVDEPLEIGGYWRDDMVGVPARLLVHLRRGADRGRRAAAPHRAGPAACRCTAPTSPAAPAGRFHGPLVVSMRPVPAASSSRGRRR